MLPEYSGELAYKDNENKKISNMIQDAKTKNFKVLLFHRYNRFYQDQFKSMFYKKS